MDKLVSRCNDKRVVGFLSARKNSSLCNSARTTIGKHRVTTEIRKYGNTEIRLTSVYLRFTSVIFSRYPVRNPQAICNLGFSDSCQLILYKILARISPSPLLGKRCFLLQSRAMLLQSRNFSRTFIEIVRWVVYKETQMDEGKNGRKDA